jgi:hypothetical protein
MAGSVSSKREEADTATYGTAPEFRAHCREGTPVSGGVQPPRVWIARAGIVSATAADPICTT